MLPKKKINECKEGWKNFTTLKKLCFILAIFAIIVLLMDLFLGFIDRYHSLFIVFCFIVYLIARSIYLYPSDIIPPKEQIKELLSERWDRWKSRSGLKKTYFVLASIVVSIFVYSFWFIFPEFINKIDDDKTSFYNLSVAVFAIFSGFGAVFGFYTSIIKTETAEQGQITERLNKAIENLGKSIDGGKPVIEVRIGALYALERIAQDSIRDHIQIMEILCAYIRHNSPKTDKMEELRDDIQTAITIIGRREGWTEGKKRLKKEIKADYCLNLGHCNLNNAQLHKANLSRAKLHFTSLNYAWFTRANLNQAWLNHTELNNVTFFGVATDNIYAYECDYSKCNDITQEQLDVMYCGIKVEIPNGLTRPDHWPTDEMSQDDFVATYYKWLKETKKQP